MSIALTNPSDARTLAPMPETPLPPTPLSTPWTSRCKAVWAAMGSLVRAPQAPGGSAAPTASACATALAAQAENVLASSADTPRAYRQDAAKHLYACNAARIYAGQLPPQLYAIGVLNVSIGSAGQVLRLHWLRAPGHAPEVVAEIERTVHAAAPFPRPLQLGKVVYTDTWLWDASGHFQLDTLTEGQL